MTHFPILENYLTLETAVELTKILIPSYKLWQNQQFTLYQEFQTRHIFNVTIRFNIIIREFKP